eukprot:scaffold13079_cov21-Tisochrysis_lutea.AAC.1
MFNPIDPTLHICFVVPMECVPVHECEWRMFSLEKGRPANNHALFVPVVTLLAKQLDVEEELKGSGNPPDPH